MLAAETREGDVFARLFQKLESSARPSAGASSTFLAKSSRKRASKTCSSKRSATGRSKRRDELRSKVEGALDTAHIEEILSRNALSEEVMDMQRLYSVKEEMEKAEARKLQPYFIRSYFSQAFQQLGGELRPREEGRYEITNVPAIIRERDRQITAGTAAI
jgi:hypothetical protein